jgi:hypothetical protein
MVTVHVIACPNCKQADCLEKNEDGFECECGEEFDIEEAEVVEFQQK